MTTIISSIEIDGVRYELMKTNNKFYPTKIVNGIREYPEKINNGYLWTDNHDVETICFIQLHVSLSWCTLDRINEELALVNTKLFLGELLKK